MLIPNYSGYVYEAGCDEAGRGCLAGPVVAAAVILPKQYQLQGLNDSKLTSAKTRDALRRTIEAEAISWAVGICSPEEIDQINILQASFLAMHKALDQIIKQVEHIIVDGPYFKSYKNIPNTCFVKGDSKFAAIAAASILAKTHRDEIMKGLAQSYPEYGWDCNVGYPTRAHRDAIRKLGPTPLHRRSFKLLPDPELFDQY